MRIFHRIMLSLLFTTFILGNLNAQTLDWHVVPYGSPIGRHTDLEVDNYGNFYTYSRRSITKFNECGEISWQRSLSGNNEEYIYEGFILGVRPFALTGNSGVVVSGTILSNQKPMDIDATTGTLMIDFLEVTMRNFYSKYAPNGDFLWGKLTKGNVLAMNGRPDGGFVSFEMIKSPSGSTERAHVRSFDINGNLEWDFPLYNHPNAGQAGSYPVKASVDVDDFGNINVVAGEGSGFVVLKLSGNGNLMWLQPMSQFSPCTLCENYAMTVASFSDGSFLFGGDIQGAMSFPLQPSASFTPSTSGTYTGEGFLCKMDPNGNVAWIKGLAGISRVYNIAIDNNDDIYCTGLFYAGMDGDLGPNTYMLPAVFLHDVFLLKMDSSANFIWANHIGAGNGTTNLYFDDNVFGLDVNRTGNAYVAFSSIEEISLVSWGLPNDTIQGFNLLKTNNSLCDELVIELDSMSFISCSQDGYVSISPSGGNGPYSTLWNDISSSTSEILFTDQPGIYECEVIDASGCSQKKQFLLNEASTLNWDLSANMSHSDFVPGQISIVNIDVRNQGCTSADGSVKFIVDSDVLINSISPVPSSISGDTLTWNFPNLKYDSSHFLIDLVVELSPISAPNNYLDFILLTTPLTGDSDSSNNSRSYSIKVLGNSTEIAKHAYPIIGCLTPNNERITYDIHFMNRTLDTIQDINLLDGLDLNLDLNSIRVLGSSDPVTIELIDSTIVKFGFVGSVFTDSTSNLIESSGYVIFDVLPQMNILPETVIYNSAMVKSTTNCSFQASSYLVANMMGETDYVEINEYGIDQVTINGITYTSGGDYVQNLFNVYGCDSTLLIHVDLDFTSLSELSGTQITIFPNPTNDIVNISSSRDIEQVRVIDFGGRIVYSQNKINYKNTEISLASLQTGMYILEVLVNGSAQRQTVMKK